jgi:hypothetical protein
MYVVPSGRVAVTALTNCSSILLLAPVWHGEKHHCIVGLGMQDPVHQPPGQVLGDLVPSRPLSSINRSWGPFCVYSSLLWTTGEGTSKMKTSLCRPPYHVQWVLMCRRPINFCHVMLVLMVGHLLSPNRPCHVSFFSSS